MAEGLDSSASEPPKDAAIVVRRARERTSSLSRRGAKSTPAGKASGRKVSTRPASASSPPRRAARSLRSLAVLAAVGGLVATVAIPAYGAWQPTAEAVTLQQVAADDAQSLLVSSDSITGDLGRESYSATTPEEIAQKKAEEAAAAAAAAALEEAAAAAAERARLTTTASTSIPLNISLVSPGSGEVRWPLLNFTLGRGLWDSGYHQGVDLLAPAMEPIYATAAGVVRVSQESYGGYGVAITIDHVLGGQQVNSLYGHMTYGTRQVEAGQSVAAGQLIGFVGSTGSSTANHLHFEIHINEGVVDPWAWLQANAG